MKTDIEVKDYVFNIIENSELSHVITGNVYKDARPVDSKVEDIVITVIAGGRGDVQNFIVNVNLYFPNVNRGRDSIVDNVRARILCEKCVDLFQSIVRDDYYILLESQRIFEVRDLQFHCINNKLNINVLN